MIITTPQEVALLDSRKSVTFCKDSEAPIIGIVENMSGLECPHCHKEVNVFRKGGGRRPHRIWECRSGPHSAGSRGGDQSDAGEAVCAVQFRTQRLPRPIMIANQVEAFCKRAARLSKLARRQQH